MTPEKGKLYTLTELSKKSGVSMPTLQRYKKLYQDRIPSEGSGRTQRYPEAAIDAVQELKAENLKKRGRRKTSSGKKSGSGKGGGRATKKRTAASKKRSKKSSSSKAKSKSGGDKELLSLSEINRITGISYPTLSKYVKLHLDRIPHEGTGRKRRYYPEAVDVFREIRGASRRGPAKKSGSGGKAKGTGGGDSALARKVKSLERGQKQLSKKLDSVLKQLKRPLQISVKRS